jgi:hypothetical protein
MRLERRMSYRVRLNAEILVGGADMFGASFQEAARLIDRNPVGLAFSLLRPVISGAVLRVALPGDAQQIWVHARIVWTRDRFDGYQAVGAVLVEGVHRCPWMESLSEKVRF